MFHNAELLLREYEEAEEHGVIRTSARSRCLQAGNFLFAGHLEERGVKERGVLAWMKSDAARHKRILSEATVFIDVIFALSRATDEAYGEICLICRAC